jgi:hypothetical protein
MLNKQLFYKYLQATHLAEGLILVRRRTSKAEKPITNLQIQVIIIIKDG